MPVIRNPAQLGVLLSGYRKRSKLSQAAVAEKLGLGQGRMSELEARPETITVDQLLVILRVVGLEMNVDEAGTAPQAAKKSSSRKVEW